MAAKTVLFATTFWLLASLTDFRIASANQGGPPPSQPTIIPQAKDKMRVSQAAHNAAEAMGGEQQVLEIYSNNRDALVGLLMKNFHTSEANASVACDKYVMPVLKQHVSETVDSYALVLQEYFSESELRSLAQLFSMPVLRKFAQNQAYFQRQMMLVAGRTIGPVVSEIYTKYGPELARLGIQQSKGAN